MSIPELIDNIFQLALTLSVGVWACIFVAKYPQFLPMQFLAGASLCCFCATFYWTAYFVIYGDFVTYFSASELCYLGMYFFLIALCCLFFRQQMQTTAAPLTTTQKLLCLPVPLFAFAVNALSFAIYGGLFWHLFYAVPLIILGYVASRSMLAGWHSARRAFHLAVVCFVVFNNMMFSVSCFSWNALYLLFDFCFSLTFLAMAFFLKKEHAG